MRQVPLKDVSIFDIKFGDKVYDIETNQVGSLFVYETGFEWLEVFAKWDGSNQVVILNQCDTRYYLLSEGESK